MNESAVQIHWWQTTLAIDHMRYLHDQSLQMNDVRADGVLGLGLGYVESCFCSLNTRTELRYTYGWHWDMSIYLVSVDSKSTVDLGMHMRLLLLWIWSSTFGPFVLKFCNGMLSSSFDHSSLTTVCSNFHELDDPTRETKTACTLAQVDTLNRTWRP